MGRLDRLDWVDGNDWYDWYDWNRWSIWGPNDADRRAANLPAVSRRSRRTPRRRGVRRKAGRGRPASERRSRLRGFWPSARVRRRLWRAFRRAPRLAQVGLSVAALAGIALTANWLYQVVRKPSELLFPVSGTLYKLPAQTWRDYGPIFRRYSTSWITPEFLAALAQVEGSGNPVARTYWRWSWSRKPFDVYRPASSAVGMYQITDATFAEARRYCIHDHAVVQEGPWDDWRSCWLDALYFRVIPSDAVELTSAYLDRHVRETLSRLRIRSATLRQAQRLAAVIHLCGAGAGEAFARRGFGFVSGERCADQDPHAYVARVEAMREVFARLAARG